MERLKYHKLKDIQDAIEIKEQELELLENIGIQQLISRNNKNNKNINKNRNYTHFGKWILEVINKNHNIETVILIDKVVQPASMVCMMMSP